MMQVDVEIVDAPLEEYVARPQASATAGALAEFWGTVRDEESGARIAALHYEAYEAMAKRQMETIFLELETTFPCERVHVVHRRGWVPVKEAAIYVGVQSRHRKEAFGMLTAFMDRLKQDVPIWKTETRPS